VISVIALLLPAACAPKATPYPESFRSDRPEERIQAIHRAAETQDRAMLDRLVDRLEDDDEAVRFYAILALDKLTGTRLGYGYEDSTAERARAVKRWRAYLEERSGDSNADVTASSSGPVAKETRPEESFASKKAGQPGQ
jgi:hypothetical protein